MQYQEISVPKELTPFIKCFWLLESQINGPFEAFRDRVFPDGCMELIVHYGDPYLEYLSGGSNIQARSFIYGQIKQFIEIGPSTPNSGIVAARFYPHGAFPFLNIPIHSIQNYRIPLSDIFGGTATTLEAMILESKTNEQRISHLCEFLIKVLYNADFQNDQRILKSLVELYRSNGTINIEQLAKRVELSSKQLERQFQSKVGINPKYFARILRFQNSFRLIKSPQIKNLTQLAYAGGFSDQAHFTREFKHFSGLNPKTYFSQAGNLSDFFTD